jgi:hypothetical protein
VKGQLKGMMKKSYLWILITAVLFLSIQIVSVVVYIYSFIPYPSFWSDPFLKGVEPERDTLFYLIFLAASVVLMALSVKFVLPKMSSPNFCRKLKFWLVLEGVWCFLMVFCFFKWTTYRYPFWNILPYENSAWLQPFFCVVCAAAALSKIFFSEIEISFRRVQTLGAMKSFPRWPAIAAQVLFFAGVALILYIPKPQDVTALALVFDQWNHLDPFAGWFIKQGWYINYEQAVQILVLAAFVYVVGLFYFIRCWLNSWLLAAVGVLLTIKMGMFYYGSAPCIWLNPVNTFLAHGWDIVLFFGLWFVSSRYPKMFYGTASLIGLVLVYGWFRSNGYIGALGFDNQPMMAPLRVRQFFPFFMGYFIPIFYVFSLLVMMGKKNAQYSSRMRLPIVLCIYGLMIFIDYLEHPMIGFYGSLMVPAILILLWWFDQTLIALTVLVRRGAYAAILLLATGALLTNRLMLTYPNSIYQDKGRFANERAYYEHFDAIVPSVSLIRQLTQENQKVALLSNFETALLMQAHRQPLFKDFPVMFSSFSNEPGGLNLKTKDQCLGLINSLQEENALYVFVDERLWSLGPQALGDSGLNTVLGYLRNHYQAYTQQGFLVALQRR